MNIPARGLLDYDSMTVGRVEPLSYGLTDDPEASYGRKAETSGRIQDDNAERLLRQLHMVLSPTGDLAAPGVFQHPSAEELLQATSVLVEATGWDGCNEGRPRVSSHTPELGSFFGGLHAALVIAAYLRRENEGFPSHQWRRAKLIMAMASIWPAALDVGGFDLLMENIYARSDFDYENIVGVI
jgi:hypothetical protein